MAAKIEISTDSHGTVHAKIVGKIDEHFDAREIMKAAASAKQVVLKLDGVRSISSLGVRALEGFLRELRGRTVVLEEISAALANQFSMIPNLIGSAQVKSAKLPFVCSSCGAELLAAVPYEPNAAVAHAPSCPSCQKKMEFDGFSEEYLPHHK
jgi:anti-anti-sigma regulatory factor